MLTARHAAPLKRKRADCFPAPQVPASPANTGAAAAPEEARAVCPILLRMFSAVVNAPSLEIGEKVIKSSRKGYAAPRRDEKGYLWIEEDHFYEIYTNLCDAAGHDCDLRVNSKPDMWAQWVQRTANTARVRSPRGGAFLFNCAALLEHLVRQGSYQADARLPDPTPPPLKASEARIKRAVEGLPMRLLSGIVNDVDGEIKRLNAEDFYARYTLLHCIDGCGGGKWLLSQKKFIGMMDEIPGVTRRQNIFGYDIPKIKAYLVSIDKYDKEARYPRYF